MIGYNLNEERIRAALDAQAHSYDPPVSFKQQIDARLAWQEKKEAIPMKKYNVKKIAVAAVVACALTGTVCMAAERFTGHYFSTSSALNEVDDFADIAKLEKKTGIQTYAKEVLDNGFTFVSANTVDTSKTDAQGNPTESYSEISVRYGKDTKDVHYSMHKGTREFTERELAHAQKIESDGITYYFSQDNYLFLPGDGEPTAEDLAAEAAGDLYISYGSAEREEMVSECLSWDKDGQTYMLSGMDLDMSAEELIAMAAQMK